MILRRLLVVAGLEVYSRLLCAQTLVVEGQVLNTRTGEPVPFATLGMPGRGVGTVADEQGRYLLRLPPDTNDTLVITCVGFARTVVPPAQLAQGQREFRLAPLEQLLRGVRVEHRRVHPGQLGRTKSQGSLLWTGGSSGKSTVDDEWGWEFGTLLHPTHRTYLETFHIFLARNNYEQLRFRLNLYAVVDGQPGRALLSQDIQLTCKAGQQGWLTVDLRPYDMVLEAQPVAATIQWLQSEKTNPERKYFAFPVQQQARKAMIVRENSQAAWSIRNFQPSLYFTVLTE